MLRWFDLISTGVLFEHVFSLWISLAEKQIFVATIRNDLNTNVSCFMITVIQRNYLSSKLIYVTNLPVTAMICRLWDFIFHAFSAYILVFLVHCLGKFFYGNTIGLTKKATAGSILL